MGAVLDSAENIRQDKKNSSRQAHKTKKKLEKDKNKGVKITHVIEEAKSPLTTRIITYEGAVKSFRGRKFVVDFGDLEKQVAVMVFPEPSSIKSGEVPSAIQPELSETIVRDTRYKGRTIIYSKPKIE